MSALVLTYHAIEDGPPPLCVAPSLLARHLDCVVGAGATALTVSELAAKLASRTLPPRAVAITFDDGAASVVEAAAPLLAERGLVATVFGVARRLGGTSDWPSPPPRLRLASADGLAALAAAGWEIGSHGLTHDVVGGSNGVPLRDELLESRQLLEEAVGCRVRSFAYPYGFVPDGAATALRDAVYDAACTTRVAVVGADADQLALPRIDAHYLRRPRLLRAALAGRARPYLAARGAAARARRLVRPDHEAAGRR